MNFQKHNPTTPYNRDCTVRAISLALNMPYDDAFKMLKEAGRRDNGGFDLVSWLGVEKPFPGFFVICEFHWGWQYIRHMMVKYGIKIHISDLQHVQGVSKTLPTVNQFLTENPKGTYILTIRDHAFCAKDGTVMDFAPHKNSKVMSAFKVYPLPQS